MEIQNVLFLLVTIGALSFFAWSVRNVVWMMLTAQPEVRWDNVRERVRRVLTIAFGQKKLLRETVPGWMHFCIFWGFVTLTIGTGELLVRMILPGFGLRLIFGSFLYKGLVLVQYIFIFAVMGAILVALTRRYVTKPARLQGVDRHGKIDATIILGLIFSLMVTHLWMGETPGMLAVNPAARLACWVYMIIIFTFLNYLPYSKHFHVLSSIPNVFFSSVKPMGALPPLDLEKEDVESFGAQDVEELSWKQLLDGLTCTECGRCKAACPANFTGKLLDPRKIQEDVRKRLKEKTPLMLAHHAKLRAAKAAAASAIAPPAAPGGNGTEGAQAPEAAAAPKVEPMGSDGKRLIGDHTTEEELWACLTCAACMQECPVTIEHVPTIVQQRRYLLLTEGNTPAEAVTAMKNMENNFTPWAFSYSTRGDWAQGLDVKTLAEDPKVDVLFWVGCAGSFDDRAKKVSVAMVKILKAAGINFGILGAEEKCTGDSARRLGNEYLFQTLAKENIDTLNNYGVKRIVTACPHCFNTLKNEFPQFGGNYEVTHHSEFIQELIRQGKIKPKANGNGTTITYHDSCYLGRYNGIYDAPRALLKSGLGGAFQELPRHGDKSFCCGGGGGRFWLEEHGKRVNEERADEALKLKPSVIGVACPFCMTMMVDGVKAKEVEGVKVLDVAEVVADAL